MTTVVRARIDEDIKEKARATLIKSRLFLTGSK